jgi:hypothetical protein
LLQRRIAEFRPELWPADQGWLPFLDFLCWHFGAGAGRRGQPHMDPNRIRTDSLKVASVDRCEGSRLSVKCVSCTRLGYLDSLRLHELLPLRETAVAIARGRASEVNLRFGTKLGQKLMGIHSTQGYPAGQRSGRYLYENKTQSGILALPLAFGRFARNWLPKLTTRVRFPSPAPAFLYACWRS